MEEEERVMRRKENRRKRMEEECGGKVSRSKGKKVKGVKK